MLVYPSGLDLSTAALRLLRRKLAARRRLIGTRWRRLTCGRQALISLAHLRCGHTFTSARLASASGWPPLTAMSPRPWTSWSPSPPLCNRP